MRNDKHNAELEWFDAVERRAAYNARAACYGADVSASKHVKIYSEIDKLREGGRGHYKPKPSFFARILAFFA